MVGLAGLLGLVWLFGPVPARSGLMSWRSFGGSRSSTCAAPALPGATVDVTLSDMGMGMMGGRRMMNVSVAPAGVAAGDVSFGVWNAGRLVHELVALSLAAGRPGSRPVAGTGTVDETGSLANDGSFLTCLCAGSMLRRAGHRDEARAARALP